MGPTIYGISIKGNNTFVDSFGNYHYFNETQTDNRLKAPKSTKKHSKVIRNTNDIREINKLDTKDNFRSYYNKLYNTLIDNTAHCVPLVSSDHAYNPYHQDLIIGSNNQKINYL
ncbi:hypothetical protein LY90DRAFT_288191 [Neocallimastix californiae]|uniref:Uncharacterized protein n=1 Tax=Neocallimastix californiae TaxID=1754190 RepID=A0A1Y2CZD8_9FUNG|nr:hypothetical protein LY90DRAFT_288191 [Neocallimastix californiae]|eukprot:ORY52234.1 hypothetical protein LY90DRAFT_288191 [Neocallimastix californiae]